MSKQVIDASDVLHQPRRAPLGLAAGGGLEQGAPDHAVDEAPRLPSPTPQNK